MTVKFRQEINIINRQWSGTGTGGFVAIPEALIKLDPADYSDILSAHLEVVYKTTEITYTGSVMLYDASSNQISPATTMQDDEFTHDRARGPDISGGTYFAAGTWNARVYLQSLITGYFYIDAIRLIILQSGSSITKTSTQLEIGSYVAETPASTNTDEPKAEPIYWKYESAKWDPTPTFTFQVCVGCDDDMESYQVALEHDGGTGTWSGSTVGRITGISTEDPTIYEASFTPVNGYTYRIIFQGDDTKDNLYFYNAKVVATQSDAGGISKLQPEYLLMNNSKITDASLAGPVDHCKQYFDPAEWEGVSNVYKNAHFANHAVAKTKIIPAGSDIDLPIFVDVGGGSLTALCLYSDGTYVYVGTAYQADIRQYSWDSDGFLTLEDAFGAASNYTCYDMIEHGGFIVTTEGDASGGVITYTIGGGGNLTYQDTYSVAAFGLASDGSFIVSSATGTGLMTFSLDGSGNISLVDSDSTLGKRHNTIIYNGSVFIGSGYQDLAVWSVDGSGNITHIKTTTSFEPRDIAWCNGYLVAVDYGELETYSVDGSGNLTLEDTDNTFADYYYKIVAVSGSTVFVKINNAGIAIFTIDGSGNITLVGNSGGYGLGGRGYYDSTNDIILMAMDYDVWGGEIHSYKMNGFANPISGSLITGIGTFIQISSAITMPTSAGDLYGYAFQLGT